MFSPKFFDRQGPLDFQAGEQTISAWKTTQKEINGCSYITIDEGSDGNEKLVGQTFKVLAYHFGGGKIAFNNKHPVDLYKISDSTTTHTFK